MTISTGSKKLDSFFGGFQDSMITMIYGKNASGKSTLCLMAAAELSKNNKKIIYIDTEKEFSLERLKQIIGSDYIKYLDNLLVFNPKNFKELDKQIKNLERVMEGRGVSLVILDNISNFYKLELRKKEGKEVNSILANQLTILKDLAKRHKIPVLITSQVYDDFEVKDKINMVGKFMQKFSRCLIEMNKDYKQRRLILKKHPDYAEKYVFFEINDKGLIL